MSNLFAMVWPEDSITTNAGKSTAEQPTAALPSAISTPSTPPIAFHKFPDLPAELRLKIWSFACHTPRVLDLHTTFQKVEIESTIFYTQSYFSSLSHSVPCVPTLLQVSREAKDQALTHYGYDFEVRMPCLVHPSNRWVTVENRGLWINYEWDVVMVRGYWNIIAIEDLCTRLGGRIRSLAVDVTGNFLDDLLSCDTIKGGEWPFPGLEEVLLYDGKGEDALKHGYIGGNTARRELEFVNVVVEGEIMDGETRQRLEERRLKFERIFDGLENAEREGLEREDCERKENGKRGGSTFRIDPRPNIKIMKLLIRPVAAETTT